MGRQHQKKEQKSCDGERTWSAADPKIAAMACHHASLDATPGLVFVQGIASMGSTPRQCESASILLL
jgi:hypothetical protein